MQSAFPCNHAIVQYETSDLNPTVAAILHLNPPAPHQRRHSLTRLERISLPGASLLLLPGPHRGRRAASAPPHRGAAAAPPCRGGIQAWTRATMGGRELHGRAAASSSCRAPLLLCGRAGWGERRREGGPPPGGGRHGEQRNRPARARRERGEDARQGGRGEAPRGGRRRAGWGERTREREGGRTSAAVHARLRRRSPRGGAADGAGRSSSPAAPAPPCRPAPPLDSSPAAAAAPHRATDGGGGPRRHRRPWTPPRAWIRRPSPACRVAKATVPSRHGHGRQGRNAEAARWGGRRRPPRLAMAAAEESMPARRGSPAAELAACRPPPRAPAWEEVLAASCRARVPSSPPATGRRSCSSPPPRACSAACPRAPAWATPP